MQNQNIFKRPSFSVYSSHSSSTQVTGQGQSYIRSSTSGGDQGGDFPKILPDFPRGGDQRRDRLNMTQYLNMTLFN